MRVNGRPYYGKNPRYFVCYGGKCLSVVFARKVCFSQPPENKKAVLYMFCKDITKQQGQVFGKMKKI